MAGDKGPFMLVAVFLIALLRSGSGLECYECGEQVGANKDCVDPNGNKSPVRTCSSDEVCVYHEISPSRFQGMEIPGMIARSCGKPNHCSSLADVSALGIQTKNCTTCNEDYCNLSKSGQKCYQCIEELGTNKGCVDPSGNKSPSVTCQNGEVCVAHEIHSGKVNGEQVPGSIVRTCGKPNYCSVAVPIFDKLVGLRTKSCTTCTTDNCNRSALKCHHCGEEVGANKGCVDDAGNKSPAKTCASEEVCVYREVKRLRTELPGMILRTCGMPGYCSSIAGGMGLQTIDCTTCTEDLCN